MLLKHFVRLTLLGLTSLCLLPNLSFGQMFSVDQDRQRRDVPSNRIYLGFEPVKFSYFGPAANQGQARYDMNSPILRVRYESKSTELFLGYGDAFTGADSVNLLHLGASFSRSLPIYTSKKFRVLAPIQLQADLTTASNDRRFNEQFQQSAVLIGAGPGLYWRFLENFRWTARMVPHIGYSLSPGGTFGGTLYQLEGQTRIIRDKIFGKIGLSIGYDYVFRKFNIDVDRFDYTLRSHSILIGITF